MCVLSSKPNSLYSKSLLIKFKITALCAKLGTDKITLPLSFKNLLILIITFFGSRKCSNTSAKII